MAAVRKRHLSTSTSGAKEMDEKLDNELIASLNKLVLKSQINQYNADSLSTILKHYTLEVFSMVEKMYIRDIQLLHYELEIELLRSIIQYRDRLIE